MPQPTRLKGRKNAGLPSSPQRRAVCGCRSAESRARKGQSLPPGITRCDGDFAAGEWCAFVTRTARKACPPAASPGLGAAEIKARKLQRVEVVHRDNLVIL